jgi:predicted ester cyclase
MTDIRLSGLRGKAQRLYREYAAILILTNQVTVERKKQLDASKAYILSSNKSEIRELIQHLEEEIPDYARNMGLSCHVRSWFVSRIWQASPNEKPYLLIPNISYKLSLLTTSAPSRSFLFFRCMHRSAVMREVSGNPGTGDYMILEAALFEDMYALFNLIKQHSELLSGPSVLKKHKRLSVLFIGLLSPLPLLCRGIPQWNCFRT